MSQNYPQNQYDTDFSAPPDLFAIAAAADERAGFIMKTYFYLFGAIASLIVIETFFFTVLGLDNMVRITQAMFGGTMAWLVVIGIFMVVSWVANSWAMNSTSSAMQHAGLALYIGAMSILLIPLLTLAYMASGNNFSMILSAATTTGGLFAALTAAVFITKKDFSFLRSLLVFGSFAALGFIITALLFGLSLGPIFMYAMIALMCCYILYDTSNVLHHYRIGQHCAAALALFASVVMLFWYILQLYLNRE